MPSDSPREATTSGRDRSTVTPEAASNTDIPAPPSRAERVQSWLLGNSLRIQVLLAAMAVAAGIIALPVVIFGSFTALGGDTSILSAGMVIVAVGFAITTVLAAWVVVYAYIETRNQGLPFGDTHGFLSVSDGVWSLKVATAGVLLTLLLASIILALTIESGPTLMLQGLGVSCLLLPIVVFLHATVEVAGSMLGSG